MILDASAWMTTTTPQGTLMEQVRDRALAYGRALPPADRILVVCGDALALPLTGFEPNRQDIEDAIRECQAGFGAIDIAATLDLARKLQTRHSRNPGEVVLIGSGRTTEGIGAAAPTEDLFLRFIPVELPNQLENVGLRRKDRHRGLLLRWLSQGGHCPSSCGRVSQMPLGGR